MNLKPMLQSLSLSALLFGSLLASALADASADAESAPTSLSTHHYTFAAGQIQSRVFVWLYDDQDERFQKKVIEVLADAGGKSKMDRATTIAARMQTVCDSDPTFANDLKVSTENGLVVVVAQTSQGNLVVTADERSKRTLNASTCQVYAQRIINGIRDRLKGLKLRDAAFDYQLNPEQKAERAAEYYLEAQDALNPDDKDTDAALCKYQLAINYCDNPASRNYYRLQLAALYSELDQKSLAKTLYQEVQNDADADADDRKDASNALHGFGANNG